jgi:two-component system, OmpR family, response regulator RegX3
MLHCARLEPDMKTMIARIALVEDDLTQRQAAVRQLEDAGMMVKSFSTPKEFFFGLERESFDLAILDWGLPEMSGPEVLAKMRSSGNTLPVLFVTARDGEDDVVRALDTGADDYLVKPLRGRELISRIMAVLRRANPGAAESRFFEFDRFKFDLKAMILTDESIVEDNKEVELTHKEFNLALIFLKNVGKPLSRSHIREAVWGRGSEVPSRTMDTHVSRVRTKLRLRPEAGYLLAPVYSYGYRLEHVSVEQAA